MLYYKKIVACIALFSIMPMFVYGGAKAVKRQIHGHWFNSRDDKVSFNYVNPGINYDEKQIIDELKRHDRYKKLPEDIRAQILGFVVSEKLTNFENLFWVSGKQYRVIAKKVGDEFDLMVEPLVDLGDLGDVLI